MQYAQPSCQLPRARKGDSRLISPHSGGTQGHQAPVLETFRVSDAAQWLSTTTGRIAPEAYSWMQAVHWIAGCGLYNPATGHGPKWGPTTVAVAQEIAALVECRPGIDYLARKLGMSERTVQYHLAHLRAAGLLVYRSRGTRLAGRVRLASVYERVIPAQFDRALGIRTVLRDEAAPAYERTAVGIAEEGRTTIATLARKAARKVRRKRTKQGVDKSVDGKGRCTPMQVGTSAVSTTGSLSLPPEKLASGKKSSPTPKQQKPKRRALNRVGRRHQLARELITAVPWLGQAAAPRIAWIVRHVADAGWSCDEVCAFLSLADISGARRPSGMLAHRLKGAHQLWATPGQRAAGVEAWHQAEEQRRQHRIATVRADRETTGDVTHTQSAHAIQAWADATHAMQEAVGTEGATCHGLEDLRTPEDLSREEVLQHRAWAEQDPGFILAALDCGMTEHDARRLYTNRLVDHALRTTLTPAF
ncbi:transcriptional regulator [Streptomyces zaomyceticus]|uniref:transcriptional regulator n=1 Tax=Streptomyces zaomyceticus TaxID=68286 RepID=UPI0037BA4EFC